MLFLGAFFSLSALDGKGVSFDCAQFVNKLFSNKPFCGTVNYEDRGRGSWDTLVFHVSREAGFVEDLWRIYLTLFSFSVMFLVEE